MVDPGTGDVIVKKGRMFTQRALKQMSSLDLTRVPIEREDLLDKAIAFSVDDPKTGAPMSQANDVVDESMLKQFEDSGIQRIRTAFYRRCLQQ